MMLQNILEKLGGEIVRRDNHQILQILVPGPYHSPQDRSLSISIGNNGKLILYQHNGNPWQQAMDYLRDLKLLDDAPGTNAPAPARLNVSKSDDERTAVAQRIWDTGVPVGRTLSETYLRRFRRIRRNVTEIQNLRHGLVPLSPYNPSSKRLIPSLMARLQSPNGKLTAIEVTYLDRHGDKNTSLDIPRKAIGPVPRGSYIQLDEVKEEFCVGEGVMTTLSATEEFGLPGLALRGGNMRFFEPPQGTKFVLIAADNGKGGPGYAADLAKRCERRGIKSEIKFPPANFDDWNSYKKAQYNDLVHPVHNQRQAGSPAGNARSDTPADAHMGDLVLS